MTYIDICNKIVTKFLRVDHWNMLNLSLFVIKWRHLNRFVTKAVLNFTFQVILVSIFPPWSSNYPSLVYFWNALSHFCSFVQKQKIVGLCEIIIELKNMIIYPKDRKVDDDLHSALIRQSKFKGHILTAYLSPISQTLEED